MIQWPIKMPGVPSYRASVDRSSGAENLKAVASSTDDPEILLGLCFYAKANDPVRKELGEMAIRASSKFPPIVAVLTLMMDGINDVSIAELVHRDPNNSLGHYLQGTLLHITDRENEALVAFRKAAACSEMRCYDSITGAALLKALDALGLQGLDRLCALSWTASRWTNFSSLGIQPIYWALSELARNSDTATRTEIADILLTLAGHLFTTNFTNRWFARVAVQSAFVLKAELAAERAPIVNGYAAAIQGLTNAMMPSCSEDNTPNILQLAQFLPSRIHRAFAAEESVANREYLCELDIQPPESDRVAFETTKENSAKAARKLIEAALTDPDGILGAYLKGLPESTAAAQSPPWASFSTPVGDLMETRPELFKAAAANEEAMNAVLKIWQNQPSVKNVGRMMEIACALQSYARKHDMAYPDTIETLFESGEIKRSVAAESLVTGRPFAYVAAGEKMPAKLNDQGTFVLLYDDELNEDGCYPCVFASCGGSHIRPADLTEQLRRRGKV